MDDRIPHSSFQMLLVIKSEHTSMRKRVAWATTKSHFHRSGRRLILMRDQLCLKVASVLNIGKQICTGSAGLDASRIRGTDCHLLVIRG